MKVWKRFFVLWIAIAGTALWSSRGIAAPKSFEVCTHELPPHSMKASDGKQSGAATEILLATAHRLGWNLKIHSYTWMRARVEAEKGRCDLIYTILKKKEYENFVVYPTQHLANRYNVFIVLKKSGLKYNGDLAAFMKANRIGTYQDKAVSPQFDQLKTEPWAKLEYTPKPENIILMLLSGRVDAVIENEATARYELGKLGRLDEVSILAPPIFVTPAFIAFSKKGRALPFVADFDRELGLFKQTAEFKVLMDRYGLMGHGEAKE